MRTRSLLPALVLVFGCRFHRAPAEPEPVLGPSRDSLLGLDQLVGDSVRASEANGLTLFTSTVSYLRAGVPVIHGRDSLQVLARQLGADFWATSRQPLHGGVSRDRRSGYTYGIAARPDAGRAKVRFERYVAFWRRRPGEPWRIDAYAEVGGPAASWSVGTTAERGARSASVASTPRVVSRAIAEVRAADSLFSDIADRMGTALAFASMIDPYGAVFGGIQLVVGPRAVEEFYAEQAGQSSISWHPTFAEVAGSLDLGYTIGEYSNTSRGASGAAVQRFGKYLTVWRRQPDGRWKFVIDGGNGSPPKADQVSPLRTP